MAQPLGCLLQRIMHQIELLLVLQAIVTEEDGMESMAHRFLSAAVKVR